MNELRKLSQNWKMSDQNVGWAHFVVTKQKVLKEQRKYSTALDGFEELSNTEMVKAPGIK